MTPINLLLVDDEKPFIETVSKRLNKRGFIAKTVYDGAEALGWIEVDETIEVIIMDIAMPGLDGIETLQKIKKKRPLTEIIMLTGHATVQNAVKAMKFGAFDYLMKPCELDILISKVNAAAYRKRGRETKILEIRMEPYISVKEKNERIARVFVPASER